MKSVDAEQFQVFKGVVIALGLWEGRWIESTTDSDRDAVSNFECPKGQLINGEQRVVHS